MVEELSGLPGITDKEYNTDEQRVLWSLFFAAVVGASEAGLYMLHWWNIDQSQSSKAVRNREKRRSPLLSVVTAVPGSLSQQTISFLPEMWKDIPPIRNIVCSDRQTSNTNKRFCIQEEPSSRVYNYPNPHN